MNSIRDETSTRSVLPTAVQQCGFKLTKVKSSSPKKVDGMSFFAIVFLALEDGTHQDGDFVPGLCLKQRGNES